MKVLFKIEYLVGVRVNEPQKIVEDALQQTLPKHILIVTHNDALNSH
jgi:hypothetical protein